MIYLDNAATSFPKAPEVGKAMKDSIEKSAGNAGRSSYSSSVQLTGLQYDVKDMISELLNIPTPENIIFTMNATHGLNLIFNGTIEKNAKVLLSPLEHNAVVRPLFNLEKERNFELTFLDGSFSGKIPENINADHDYFILNAISNVNGQIQPFDSIKLKSTKTILDLSQAVGYLPINIEKINPDFIAFPGHKGLLGPTGIGFAWAKDWSKTSPLILGGTGSLSESISQPEFLPDKFESGTQNIVGISGMHAALEFLLKTGIEKIHIQKKELDYYFKNRLQELSEIELLETENSHIGVNSIITKTVEIDELTYHLDKNQIATRMGLHCAPMAHKFLKTFDNGGTIRFSLGYFTTKEELDTTINVIKEFYVNRKY